MPGPAACVHVCHLFSCVSGVAVWAKAAAVERLLTLRLTLLLATKQQRENKGSFMHSFLHHCFELIMCKLCSQRRETREKSVEGRSLTTFHMRSL